MQIPPINVFEFVPLRLRVEGRPSKVTLGWWPLDGGPLKVALGKWPLEGGPVAPGRSLREGKRSSLAIYLVHFSKRFIEDRLEIYDFSPSLRKTISDETLHSF